MKKFRGIRLGRRLVRIWRWVFRRRCPRNYLRLNPARSLSRSESYSSKTITSTMTTKLFDWGRDLTRRLRSSGHGGALKAHCRRLGACPPAGDWDAVGDDAVLLEHQKEGGGRKKTTPPPPPKGHLVVYVGGQKDGGPPQRYLVPVIYFNHPLFGELLREAEQEFGFHHPGGITIPCPVSRFERVQTRIAAGGRKSFQPHWI